MKTKKTVLHYRTIVLSDVHLGTKDCKIDEVNHFLKHTKCERLILNGDIIDGWSLKRKMFWTKGHTHFIRRVLKMAEKKHTDVYYLAGNHDELLRKFLPLQLDNIQFMENMVIKGEKGDYFVFHGDALDAVTVNNKFLAVIGDVGYQNLLKLNRLYNRYRRWRGKDYFSLSAAIKKKVKGAVNHLSNFEGHLQAIAEKEGYHGVICGHIHTADNKMIGKVHYLNSGDWVESLTALVEHLDGTWEVIEYEDFKLRLGQKQESQTQSHREPALLEDDIDVEAEATIPFPSMEAKVMGSAMFGG